MNPYELRDQYYRHNPSGHFFDRNTLRFFGERMCEMRVFRKVENVETCDGKPHACYVLSTLQRKRPGGPVRCYHYFDTDTYDVIFPKD